MTLPHVMTFEEAQAAEAAGAGHIWSAYVGGHGYRQHFCIGDRITHVFDPMRQQFEAVRLHK